MEMRPGDDLISQMMQRVRRQTRRNSAFSDSLSDVQKELRTRRKFFLGSHVSLRMLVCAGDNNGIDESAVDALSNYLAGRSAYFWKPQNANAETFLFRFYRLAITAIGGGNVGQESIDDLLQLATALVRSRRVFMIAMEDMLPAGMKEELVDFVENTDELYFGYGAEDAILGGLCVFLGVLPDMLSANTSEEVDA